MITNTPALSGGFYESIMFFKKLLQFCAVIAAITTGILTATLTFTALIALFSPLISLFSLTGPLAIAVYALSGLSAVTLAIKAGYETIKAIWAKASEWGEKVDAWLIRHTRKQPYYLESIDQNLGNAEAILIDIQTNINQINKLINDTKIDLNSGKKISPDILKMTVAALESSQKSLVNRNKKGDTNTILKNLARADQLNTSAKKLLMANNKFTVEELKEPQSRSSKTLKMDKKITKLYKKIKKMAASISSLLANLCQQQAAPENLNIAYFERRKSCQSSLTSTSSAPLLDTPQQRQIKAG